MVPPWTSTPTTASAIMSPSWWRSAKAPASTPVPTYLRKFFLPLAFLFSFLCYLSSSVLSNLLVKLFAHYSFKSFLWCFFLFSPDGFARPPSGTLA
jgi:hypothetical protein